MRSAIASPQRPTLQGSAPPQYSAWLLTLGAGLPLLVYALSSSAYGYWHDAGEFIAAAQSLGISHPPGHPLSGLLGHLATWLPLGNIAWRVALLSAVAAALAIGVVAQIIDNTLQRCSTLAAPWRLGLSIAAAWWIAANYGWWFQAVRPEVYAVQALLTCIALSPHRSLSTAAIALGLSLANHHFLALLTAPLVLLAKLPTTRHLPRNLGIITIGSALGLLTYLYLPLRAARAPFLNLGDPQSPANFWWVVSAKAFQKNTGDGVPQPWLDRLFDVIVELARHLHPAVIALSLAGLYLLLRRQGTRRDGLLWSAALVLPVLARAWLGFVRHNPDALGYLMLPMVTLGLSAAIFVAALLDALAASRYRSPRLHAYLRSGVIITLGVAALLRFGSEAQRASLADFRDTDDAEEEARRNLPPRSIVLAYNPQTSFRYWGAEATEALRPDLHWVPMPFLSYPGMLQDTNDSAQHPHLALRHAAAMGTVDLGSLQQLAALQPLWIELDPRIPLHWYSRLQPGSAYARWQPDASLMAAGRVVSDHHRTAPNNDITPPRDFQTQQQQLWLDYHKALLLASHGDTAAARAAVRRGLRLHPQTPQLRELLQALAEHPNTAIDVAPFMLRPAL